MTLMAIKEKKSTKHLRKNDIILIASILLVAIIGGILLFLCRGEGNKVEVTVDGKLYGTYSLSQDMTEDIILGDDEAVYNRLVIKDGKAYVESASCPDKICASHRPIHREGESIVCLPNRVVITVISSGSQESPDVIA